MNLNLPIINNDVNDNECKIWNDYCLINKWNTEQINKIEENHRLRLLNILPGTLDLTPKDSQILYSMLIQNNGSKEIIKTLRNWIINRAHSIIAISFILSTYIRNQIDPSTANREFTMINQNGYNIHQPFHHMLHTIYLINDIFFNCQTATMKGPYTKIIPTLHDQQVNIISILFTQLPLIFYSTYKMAKTTIDQDKIKRIVTIWLSKSYIDDTRSNILNSVMKQEVMNIPEPGRPPLINPFPINLPPPNNNIYGQSLLPPPPTLLGLKAPLPIQPIGEIATIDLHKVSVGNMANVLKNAFRGGHLKYHPIDIKNAPILLPPQVEPSRMQARIQEFYKNVEIILGDDINNNNEHRGIGHR